MRHLLFKCQEWTTQRQKLKGDLIRARVPYPTSWEDTPEGRILGKQRATRAVLSFLATTRVGLRSNQEIQEAERTRRDDEWDIEALEEADPEGEG